MMDKIQYINRDSGEIRTEKIIGHQFLKWLYFTPSGEFWAKYLALKIIGRLMAVFFNTKLSVGKIGPFIRTCRIEVDDFMIKGDEAEIRKSYASFNEFFSRKFRTGKRQFPGDHTIFPAIAEGRYFAYREWSEDIKVPVKGRMLSPLQILGDQYVSSEFEGGEFFIVRLAPMDYHRFHFPDEGRVMGHYRVEGQLHSLSPLALSRKEDVFLTNERHVTLLQTKNFGNLAYVEVGGMGRGKILQTYKHPESFQKGEEKGHFMLGGSTIIVFAQKGRLHLDEDLIVNTQRGLETFVKLGSGIGKNASPW